MQRLIKKLLAIFLLSSPAVSLACDPCAENAIRGGFNAINEAIELVGDAVDSFRDSVDKLKDQIQSSSNQIADTVDQFSDDMTSSLRISAKDITKMISGLTSTVEGSMKLSQKMSTDLSLSLQNHITEVAKKSMMQIITNDALYQAGGAFGHFEGGEKVTGLFMLYEAGLRKAKILYVKHAQGIKDWNMKSERLDSTGRRALITAAVNEINAKKDDLLFEMANNSTLSNQSYEDIKRFISIGLNPNQISSSDPRFVNLNAYQSEFLSKVMYKAPIVEITQDNLEQIGSILLVAPLPPEQCPADEVREEAYCTSLYNLLESLAYRPHTADYANKQSLAAERAILEELNRSMIQANMMTRYNNHIEAYNAYYPNLD